jgi:hypothetical protein
MTKIPMSKFDIESLGFDLAFGFGHWTFICHLDLDIGHYFSNDKCQSPNVK